MQPQEGTPVPTPQPTPQPSPQPSVPGSPCSKTNTMAIFGLVLAFFIPILGLILSIVAKSQIKKTGEGGNGLATGGIVVSIIFMVLQIIAVIFYIFVIAAVVATTPTDSSTSSTNSSTTTSTTDTSSYSADEKKAVVNSEAFLRAIQAGDYTAAYNLLGPELKKEYPGGQAEFQKEVESANLKLIKSWEIESATTNGAGDRITVKGTAKFSGANPTGTLEFGYYKDTDGSIRMYLWQISPTN